MLILNISTLRMKSLGHGHDSSESPRHGSRPVDSRDRVATVSVGDEAMRESRRDPYHVHVLRGRLHGHALASI